MNRRIFKWVFPAIVFLLTWLACKPIFKTMGPHTWHRAHLALKELKLCADFYKDDHGRYPPEGEVNRWLEQLWEREGESEASGNSELASFSDLYHVTSYQRLKRWQVPPVYVVDESIPDGCGFYTVGDDGLSSSNGNDPDDINSWDPSSISFYHRKLWRHREIRDVSVSLGFALIAFVALKIRWIT